RMTSLCAGVALAAACCCVSQTTAAATPGAAPDSLPKPKRKPILPLLREEAEKRGIELPLPYGAGFVYYHLDRAIEISDVRVGRNGAPPTSVSQFAQLSSSSSVNNENLKLDVWILPFFNVYAIAGYVANESETRIDVTPPPLTPGGPTRRKQIT